MAEDSEVTARLPLDRGAIIGSRPDCDNVMYRSLVDPSPAVQANSIEQGSDAAS